jgi:hypothetical protein
MVGYSANLLADERQWLHFSLKSAIGTTLVKDRPWINGQRPAIRKKGE